MFERENHMFYFSKGMLTSIEPPYVYKYLRPIENRIE